MNELFRKHPRRVATADEPAAERLDPPGLTYIDRGDREGRMWAVIDELHGRVAKLEQQVHDLSPQADVRTQTPRRHR